MVSVQGDPISRSTSAAASAPQESDMMEYLAKGPDVLTGPERNVQLVSLGSYCGPKLTFQKIGRGAETLPFDWLRTRLEGIMKFMTNDFDGFFSYVTKAPVPNSKMVMYRDYCHSFWHDDPTAPSMHEKYRRRFQRFKSIDARSRPVLFVRSAVTTDELLRIHELLTLLVTKFGPKAHLLLILDFQRKMAGPCFVAPHPNLLLYFLPASAHAVSGNTAPYVEPVLSALGWVVGRQPRTPCFSCLEVAHQHVDPCHWGLTAFNSIKAFEEIAAGNASRCPSVLRSSM